MNNKLILILIIAGLLFGSGYFIGRADERADQREKEVKVVAKEQANQQENFEGAQAEKQKTEVIYRDRIQVVEKVADPRGCLDVDVPDDIERLRAQDRLD